jgi:hypothetical protein
VELQVTLFIRAFAVCVFAYPLFYFSIKGSINILSVATVEAAEHVQTVLRAQFHSVAPLFGFRIPQIKARFDMSLRKFAGMFYVTRFTHFLLIWLSVGT